MIEVSPLESLTLEQYKGRRGNGKEIGRRDSRQPNGKASREQASHLRPRDKSTVHLDGSTLEGGGQLVRVALTLSALTRIPVHITNIRAGRGGGRTSGGLKESHLAALEVLAEECGATVEGGHVGSKELLFEPEKQRIDKQPSKTSTRTIELERPGSVWLILQALLPWYLLRRGRTDLILKGGTNVSSSMSGDYVQQVLLPVLEKTTLSKVQVDVVRRGWAGNAAQIGEVKVSIEGHETRDAGADVAQLKPLEAFAARDRGSISKVTATVVAHPESMRTALVHRAKEALARAFPNVEIEIILNEDSHDVRRLYLLLVAHTSNGWRLGRDYLGTGKALKSQKDADALVDGAVRTITNQLLEEVNAGGCVDEYLQDQLVVFQALADGRSVVDAGVGREEGTLHARTVRWVCREMLGGLSFEVEREGIVGIGTHSTLENPGKLQADAHGTDEGSYQEFAGPMS